MQYKYYCTLILLVNGHWTWTDMSYILNSDASLWMIKYHLSQKVKSIGNNEFNHLIIILKLPFMCVLRLSIRLGLGFYILNKNVGH